MPRLVFIKTTREMASINFDCNRLIIYFYCQIEILKRQIRITFIITNDFVSCYLW
jgi:hypothetical protein